MSWLFTTYRTNLSYLIYCPEEEKESFIKRFSPKEMENLCTQWFDTVRISEFIATGNKVDIDVPLVIYRDDVHEFIWCADYRSLTCGNVKTWKSLRVFLHPLVRRFSIYIKDEDMLNIDKNVLDVLETTDFIKARDNKRTIYRIPYDDYIDLDSILHNFSLEIKNIANKIKS